MKILTLCMSNVYRPRDGTALTVYNRWKRLGKRHQVTLVIAGLDSKETDEWVTPPEEYTERVIAVRTVPASFGGRLERKLRRSVPWVSRQTGYWFNAELRQVVKEQLSREKFDFIQVEPFPLFWAIPQDPGVPISFLCNDVLSRFVKNELDAAKTPLEKFWFHKQLAHIRALEVKNWKRAAHIFTFTQLEADLIKKDLPSAPVTVAANGVDIEFLSPGNDPIRPNEILFVGVLDVEQNIDAVNWFGREVFPLVRRQVPDAVFTLVGRAPVPEVQALGELPGVEVVGEVPDVRPFLRRAHVVVSPVRLGGGMKGKTVEAMAMKKPLISTTFAAEGVAYTPEGNILLGDTPEEMARQTVRVLNDAALAARLGENGRLLVEERYSWDAIVDIYDRVYHEIAGEAPANTRA